MFLQERQRLKDNVFCKNRKVHCFLQKRQEKITRVFCMRGRQREQEFSAGEAGKREREISAVEAGIRGQTVLQREAGINRLCREGFIFLPCNN
jgi:hypothetical protein